MTKNKNYEIDIRIAGILDKSLAQSIKGAKYQVSSFHSQVQAAAPMFNSMERIAGTAFRAVSRAAIITATAAAKGIEEVTKLGMGFEKQMSAVKAIAEGTASEMEMITTRARQLGRETIYTAENIGQAMESMALSGWEAQEIYDGIAGVISLAAASGEELAEMSTIMTDTLHAYNLEAKEAERVSDILAATALNSNTNVMQLGNALKYVGPVAGSLGYSLEDTALALGLFANQGLKATQAGTALRTTMSKLYKTGSVKVGQKTISVTDEEGDLRNLIDLIYDLRNAFNVLPAAEKGINAFSIGGIRGSTGLLALANASDADIQKLYQQITNADYFDTAGTAAKVRLDNLAGDIELLKDAAKDVGLTIYDDIDSPIRDVIQWTTGKINVINKQIKNGELFGGAKKWLKSGSGQNVTSYLQNLLNILKDIKEPTLNTIGKLSGHLNDLTGAVAGFLSAIALYKGVSAVDTFITTLGGFNPVSITIMGAATAIGWLTTRYLNMRKAVEEASSKSLTEHFGDIALSTEEITRAVDNLIGTKKIADLERVVGAIERADEAFASLQQTNETLNKYNWEFIVGIELEGSDYEDYGEQIQKFVDEATQYARDERYAVAIATQLILPDETNGIGGAYVSAEKQIRELGAQMSDEFNKAFVDGEDGEGGIFNVDLLDTEKIARLQAQIAEITTKMAEAESAANLEGITRRFSGTALTPESFMQLMGQYGESNQSAIDQYYQAYQATLKGINFNGGTQAEKDAAWRNYLLLANGATSKAYQYGLDTLNGTYGTELATGKAGLQNSINKYLQDVLGGRTVEEIAASPEYAEQILGMLSAGSIAENISSGLSVGDRTAISKLLDALVPTTSELETLKGQFEAAGLDASIITDELESYKSYRAIADGGEALIGYVQDAIGNDTQWSTVVAAAEASAGTVPEGIGGSMVQAASTDAVKTANAVVAEYQSALANGFDDFGVDVHFSATVARRAAVGAGSTDSYNKRHAASIAYEMGTLTLPGYASGGIIGSPTVAAFAEDGPEAAIPLDGSRRALNLWRMAGEILGRKSGLADSIGGAGGIVFSPNITINGNADRGTVLSAIREAEAEFDTRMRQWLKQNQRVSFA